MLQNRGYSTLNGPVSYRVLHKTGILKMQISKKCTLIFLAYLHKMFTEQSEQYTECNFEGPQIFANKSPFYNKGVHDSMIKVDFFYSDCYDNYNKQEWIP